MGRPVAAFLETIIGLSEDQTRGWKADNEQSSNINTALEPYEG